MRYLETNCVTGTRSVLQSVIFGEANAESSVVLGLVRAAVQLPMLGVERAKKCTVKSRGCTKDGQDAARRASVGVPRAVRTRRGRPSTSIWLAGTHGDHLQRCVGFVCISAASCGGHLHRSPGPCGATDSHMRTWTPHCAARIASHHRNRRWA